MSTENRTEAPSTDSLSEQASRHTLALNPLVSLRAQDLLDSAGVLFKAMINEPRVAVAEWLSFLGEMSAIVEWQIRSRTATGRQTLHRPDLDEQRVA